MTDLASAARSLAAGLTAVVTCPQCADGACPDPGHSMSVLLPAAEAVIAGADLTPDRRAHTLAVGARTAALVAPLGMVPAWSTVAQLTGVLHDVGYASVDTGMHALDGGRWLARQGFPPEVVSQVAWHSTAYWEAQALGLSLAEFPAPEPVLQAFVWVADFTTGPTGRPVSVAERVTEIRGRYPADGAVVAGLDAALPALATALDVVAALQSAEAVSDELVGKWPAGSS